MNKEKEILSLDNPEIKHLVKLHYAKGRKEHQQCIVEGYKAIETAVQGGLKLNRLYVTGVTYNEGKSLATELNTVIVTPEIMLKITTLQTPSNIIGLFSIPDQPSAPLNPGLVLCNIQDPGNMGMLIRTAAACGIKTVICIEGADAWGPKVIHASVGTIAYIQIYNMSWNTLLAQKGTLPLYGLVMKDGKSPALCKEHPGLLVVGNEGQGIPERWLDSCDERISLPMPGGIESLNAAVAGSIALYISFAL